MSVLNNKRLKKNIAAVLIFAFFATGQGLAGVFRPVSSYAEPASGAAQGVKTPVGYSNITVDVVNTDIRDMLSLFSLSLGKSMVFIDQPINVTFKAENVEKMQAFELFLKYADLSYYDYGNVIVVGKSEKMPGQQVVQEQPYITRFDLNYISAQLAVAQFEKLGLELPKVAIDTNTKMLWVNATAIQLARANEIIQAIDIPENADKKEPVVFERVELKYITADSALTMLEGLFDDLKAVRGGSDSNSNSNNNDSKDKNESGKDYKNDSKIFYLHVSQSRLKEIYDVLEKLDIPENGAIDILIKTIQLRYTNSGIASKMIQQAEIDVKVVTSDANNRIFWAIGKKEDLEKLDRFMTNVDIAQNETQGASLEKITLKYLTADKVSGMIEEFSVPVKLFWMDENPMQLMVMGTKDYIDAFKQILTQIDVPENQAETAKIVSYKLTYISAEDVKKTIEQLGMQVTLFNMETNPSVLWAKGQEKDLNELQILIDKLDIQDNVGVKDDTVIKVYQFSNMTARTAADRLKQLGINSLRTIVPQYDQYEKFLIAVYPNTMDATVTSAINSLDVIVGKIKVPIDFASGVNAPYALQARKELLSVLTGVPMDNFHISNNVSRDYTEPYYVLWLEDTSDNIKRVRDMVDSINNP